MLYHLPRRDAVLRRLWETVAPGGHLVVRDYDLRGCGALPPLASIDERARGVSGAFSAAGRDVALGTRPPLLFEEAGSGAPDGTDVAGRLEPLADAQHVFAAVFRSVLPTAIAHRITSERKATPVVCRHRGRRRALPASARPLAVADRRLEAQATRSRLLGA